MPDQNKELANIPQIIHADSETVDRPDYYWVNQHRLPRDTLVIQRTSAGAAILSDREGEHIVTPGKAMLFVYGEPSRYYIGDASQRPYRLEYAVIRAAGGILELLRQLRDDFGSIVSMAEKGESARLLKDLVLIFRGGRSRDQLEMAELAYRLMLAIYREQLAGTLGSDPVSYLRYVLQTQFRSPRNLKEWMAELPLSREHMTRSFTERYGEGPAAFLRNLRLSHARLLARTTVMPVEDISAASGFASTQTFRRAYRRQFGAAVGVDRPLSRPLTAANPRK